MKICTKCKQEKSLSEFYKNKQQTDGLHCYCKDCTREIQRQNRLNNKQTFIDKDKRYYKRHTQKVKKARKDWYAKNKHKMLAHQAVKSALYKGFLKKENCKECGEVNTVAHHPDYSKPLEVMWLCVKHHMILHHGK